MSRKFEGLCVGGPLNGKMVSHNAPFLSHRLLDSSEPTALHQDLNIEDVQDLKSFEYTHRPRLLGNIPSIDLWIPRDKKISWAIEQIINHFKETANGL